MAFGDDLLTPDFALAAVAAGTPAGATYSYVFDGNAQSLDHVLLSPEAVTSLTAFDHARINADFPEVYRGDADPDRADVRPRSGDRLLRLPA